MIYLPDLCRAAGLPMPFPEYQFAKPRRWRADFCWTAPYMVILEINGGVFGTVGSRHNRGAGYRADLEKLNAAAILGYRVLQYLPEQVARRAIADLLQILPPIQRTAKTGIGPYPIVEV